MVMPEEYNATLKNYDEALKPIEFRMKQLEAGNKNSMGLLSAEVKNSPEYIDLKNRFNRIFNQRKKFCSLVPNNVKSQASQLRRQEKINKNSRS